MQKTAVKVQKRRGCIRWAVILLPLALLLGILTGPFAVPTFAIPSPAEQTQPIPDIPASLLYLNEKEASYAFLVDKSEQRLYLYKWEGERPMLVKSFACSTGENSGGKNRNGDKRTPDGVYFFTRVIESKKLAPKYGIRAYPTDYPNLLDRLTEKDGDGIWLHGTDRPLSSKSTKGCVVLENKDVVELSSYIRLRRTPIVIEEKISKSFPEDMKKQGELVKAILEEWRQAWETKQIDRYMAFYSKKFRSGNKDWLAWRNYKERLNQQYREIIVNINDPIIIGYGGNILAVFNQVYKSDLFSNEGTKRLYFDQDLKIIGEEWDVHKNGETPPPIPEKVMRAFFRTNPVKVAAITETVTAPPAQAREENSGKVAGDGIKDVRDFLEIWRQAWETKDLDTYMDCYSHNFRAQGKGWEKWKQHKQALNKVYSIIKVSLQNVKIDNAAEGTSVSFYQNYRSDGISSMGIKSLELKRENNGWKIVRERFLASRK
jgi:murein L,D-transpeptidase YafK